MVVPLTIPSRDVIRSARVRRAKLYFLRDRSGKSVRLRERYNRDAKSGSAPAAEAGGASA